MDEGKINHVKQTMIEAMAQSDSTLYSMVYGQEGQILMEGGLVIQGPENIENQIRSFMDLLGPLTFKLTKKDLWDQGDIAYESGFFSYSYSDQNEEPFYTGTYVYIWKQCDNGEVCLLRNVSIDD
ncbi:YybH family protein [Guggenheimella bovis]